MPTWNQIDEEIDALGQTNACDQVRIKYLAQLRNQLQQPVIAYYSGFLQERLPDGRYHPEASISDHDMNGLMVAVHGLDRSLGLTLLLHTPGGDIEAARGFVEYLYKMFGKKIHVIVPQLAMSAGTMIACACSHITMAKHSCLGPTDPQIGGMPAMGVLSEIDRAIVEIQKDPRRQLLWQQVFSKYPPGFILNCERAVEGAKVMVKNWLKGNMLSEETSPDDAAAATVSKLMDLAGTSGHSHHFPIDKCREFGLKVNPLEDDQALQEAALSVHHAFMASFARTSSIKIVQNSEGGTWAVNAK